MSQNMRLSTESRMADCPYCGERFELVVDPSVADQEYVEDCFVCCRPIVVSVQVADTDISVYLRAEDEI
jgi:hypothetical protein